MSGKSVTLTRQLSEEHTAGGDEKPRRLTVDDVPSLRMTRKTDRKSSLFENDEYFTPRSLATSLGGLTIAAEKEPKADMVFAAICQALDAGIDDATTCEHGCVAVRNLTVGLDVSVRVCSVRTVAVAIGAADRVVAAMRRHPLNASIAEHGCAALRNLGSGADDLAPRRQQDLVDAGALEVAAEALNRVAATQVKVLEEGAAVIANATAGSGADARKAAAADAGCVDAAVTAMRKVTGGAAAVKGDAAAVAVLEVACTVLLNVCSGAAAEPHPRKEAAIEARACESLAMALGAGATGEPPLALAATCALLTIANGEGAAAGARAGRRRRRLPRAAGGGDGCARRHRRDGRGGMQGALRAHRRLRRAPGGGGGRRLHEGRRRRAHKVRRRDDGARVGRPRAQGLHDEGGRGGRRRQRDLALRVEGQVIQNSDSSIFNYVDI